MLTQKSAGNDCVGDKLPRLSPLSLKEVQQLMTGIEITCRRIQSTLDYSTEPPQNHQMEPPHNHDLRLPAFDRMCKGKKEYQPGYSERIHFKVTLDNTGSLASS
jgi:hypothetical protein